MIVGLVFSVLNMIIKKKTFLLKKSQFFHSMTLSYEYNAHQDFKCHIITLNDDFVPSTVRDVFYLFIFLWSSKIQLTRFLGDLILISG